MDVNLWPYRDIARSIYYDLKCLGMTCEQKLINTSLNATSQSALNHPEGPKCCAVEKHIKHSSKKKKKKKKHKTPKRYI